MTQEPAEAVRPSVIPTGERPCPVCSNDAIVFHVGAGRDPDLAVVDLLARLHLTARRRGQVVLVCHAPAALLELLRFAGVADVIDVVSVVQPGREPEQREQPIGAEEGVHRPDLPG